MESQFAFSNYEPEWDYEDDYSDLSVSYDEHEPFATKNEQVFLNGYFYDVIVTVEQSGDISIVHRPVEYTCWDGQLPF